MLSLYANLLDPAVESTPGTISRAPVVFKQASEGETPVDESVAKKQMNNGMRHFAYSASLPADPKCSR
jgi:splicing factor 45